MHLKKIRLFISVLVLFFVCCFSFLSAQESDDWYYSKEIIAVKFNGLVSVKRSDLNGITKEYIGLKFSDDLYFELLGRIGALDYFESIDPVVSPGDTNYNTVIITFDVVENPSISKIKFVGNRKVNDTTLRGQIVIKAKDIFQEALLSSEELKIREYYLSKGYTNVRISSTYKYTDDGVEVSFLINEGTATTLRSITFEGNQVVSARTLQGTMKLKTKSLFSTGAFQESTLEADKQAILLYYQNRGYVDAELTDVIRDESVDDNGNSVLDLTFVIYEGYQYTYGGIEITGNTLFSSEYLESKIKLEPGEVFNYTKFSDGLSLIADSYYQNGYITTSIAPDQYKDADRREISFRLYIDERARSHIESIIVQGNKKTKTNVITRELPFVAGDIFSVTDYQKGYQNLVNLQYFSSVVPEVIPGSEDDLVNVIYNVEDTSTTSIEFGLSFAGLADPNSFPVSLTVNWADSNFMGEGRNISLAGSVAPDRQAISFSYGDNWLFDKPLAYNGSISFSHTNNKTAQQIFGPWGRNTSDFMMKYNQLSLTISNALGKRWYFGDMVTSLSAGLDNNFLRNFYDAALIPVDTSISQYKNRWGMMNTVWAAASADTRDFTADPTSGWFVSQRLAWVGLLPNIESQYFMRSDTVGEYYLKLADVPVTEKWNFRLVFAALSSIEYVRPLTSATLSDNNRVFIDGMFSARGWDSVYNTKGDFLWSTNLELRMPVIPNILAADIFFDAAALKRFPNLSFSSRDSQILNKITLDDFYFSFGPGIRSLVQQFPLRFLLANTFKIQNGHFHWGNGRGPDFKVVVSFTVAK